MTIIVYDSLRDAFTDSDKRTTLGFIASRPMLTPEGAWLVRYL